ncbi:MAG: beta-phosphoglucomutase [Spirochaetaceae bacterium]|jgi:beta-phosphoglucomutase|nr:beta-phosphoglucomutase [Spirochaetaceae bacterium]
MIPRAIIFDLDGVLVDTAKYHYKAWRKLAQELGFDFTEQQNHRFKGVSRMASLELLLDIAGLSFSQEEKREMADKKNRWYLEYIDGIGPEEVLPGVFDFLKELQGASFKMVLGSASKNAPKIMERTQLLPFFDEIIDGNIVSKAKPDPEVFTLGAKRVGIPFDQSVVFEDAPAGIQAANTAGMFSIGVGSEEQLNEAKVVIPGFLDFTLEKFNRIMGA